MEEQETQVQEETKTVQKNSGMKYGKFKEVYVNLEQIGNIPDLPVGKVVALNVSKMKKIITEKEEVLEEILTKYATTDENGERLGVKYQHELEDGNTEERRRELKGYYPYDHVEVENRKAYDKEIKEYLDAPVDYNFVTVKSNKKVAMVVPREYEDKEGNKKVSNVEREMQLLDVLERKMSGNAIAFLLDHVIEIVEE